MLASRIRYYLQKSKQAFRDGTFTERIARKLFWGTRAKLETTAAYFRLPLEDRRLDIEDGFADHRSEISFDRDAEIAMIERLIAAYLKAKADESGAAPPFVVRGLWAEWIQINYQPLTDAIASRDLDFLIRLLSNFAREQIAVGTGSCYDDVVIFKTSLTGKYYIKSVWCDYRNKLVDAGSSLAEIEYSNVGNPAGVPVDGRIISIETLRHAYNARTVAEILRNIANASIVEIGGGFGGQAFQTIGRLRKIGNPAGKYFNFDIPEVLFIASYFLLKSLPEHRIRLYGEGPINDDDFDIGLFPHFAIDGLADMSVDLVFNSHSFSEMEGSTARHYLSIVERICRHYFYHINHDFRLTFKEPNGDVSSNMLGSELVPDEKGFSLVFKRPRVFGRPEDKPFKSFSYLYERVGQ
ncbi:MAG: putative sugar O-methyltransferase [Pyrinomonadaceae bacterium]